MRIWVDNWFGTAPEILKEWYNDGGDHDSATLVDVAPEAMVSGIDMTVGTVGFVKGQVTNSVGEPLAQARVEIRPFTGGNRWQHVATGDDGRYAFQIDDGEYRIRVSHADAAAEYFDDQPFYVNASPVVVEANSIARVDVDLDDWGSISGVVTTVTGEPVEGATVIIWNHTHLGGYNERQTDALGRWTMEKRISGWYTVSAYRSDLQGATWQNEANPEDPSMFLLGRAEQLTGVDLSLTEKPSISGRVTDLNGQPIEGALVRADSATVSGGAQAISRSDGRYQLFFDEPAGYRLRATSSGHVQQWWEERSDRDQAILVEVGDSGQVKGVDFSLQTYGTLTGRVTNAQGEPIENIQVGVEWLEYQYRLDGYGLPTATTDANGNYELQGVHPAPVKLSFVDPTGTYIDWRHPNPVEVPLDGSMVIDLEMKGRNSISLSGRAQGITVHAATDRVYVSLPDDNKILVVRLSTGETLSSLDLPVGYPDIATTSDGGELAVVLDSWELAFVDVTTGEVEVSEFDQSVHGEVGAFTEFAPQQFAVLGSSHGVALFDRSAGTTQLAGGRASGRRIDSADGVVLVWNDYSMAKLEASNAGQLYVSMESIELDRHTYATIGFRGRTFWLSSGAYQTSDFAQVASFDPLGSVPLADPTSDRVFFAGGSQTVVRSGSGYPVSHIIPTACGTDWTGTLNAAVSEDGRWVATHNGSALCLEQMPPADEVGDADDDGLADNFDNCPGVANPDQYDGDADRFGDACDANLEDGLQGDLDGDQLRNELEWSIGTNAAIADSDYDFLDDGVELYIGSSPVERDTDGDGLRDGVEALFGLNPLLPDSDAGGTPDGQEVRDGTNAAKGNDDLVRPQCTIIGTPGDDVLFGTPGTDVVCGGGGDDILVGGGGDDWLIGGSGDDWLVGQEGDDWLVGEWGNDVLAGNEGDDWLFGGIGDDGLRGGSGRDWLRGGNGADACGPTTSGDVVVRCDGEVYVSIFPN